MGGGLLAFVLGRKRAGADRRDQRGSTRLAAGINLAARGME